MIKIVYNTNNRFDKYKQYLINIINNNSIGKYDLTKDIVLINTNIYTEIEILNAIFQKLSIEGYSKLQIEFKNK